MAHPRFVPNIRQRVHTDTSSAHLLCCEVRWGCGARWVGQPEPHWICHTSVQAASQGSPAPPTQTAQSRMTIIHCHLFLTRPVSGVASDMPSVNKHGGSLASSLRVAHTCLACFLLAVPRFQTCFTSALPMTLSSLQWLQLRAVRSFGVCRVRGSD